MRIQASAPDRFAFRPRPEAAPPEAPAEAAPPQQATGEAQPETDESKPATGEATPRAPGDLDDKEKAQVLRLQQRDAEVRAHEAAHAAAAGMMGGGASYDYVTGPDGRQYAVGGEVPVRMSSGSSPEEAIRNAQQIRAAALAPAEPSGQDRAVAAQAAAIEAAARAELAESRRIEMAPARGSTPEVKPLGSGAASAAAQTRTDGKDGRDGKDGAAGAISAVQPSESRPVEAATARQVIDPDETARQLEAERRSTRGSWKHMHLATGCGTCSAAAARYV